MTIGDYVKWNEPKWVHAGSRFIDVWHYGRVVSVNRSGFAAVVLTNGGIAFVPSKDLLYASPTRP